VCVLTVIFRLFSLSLIPNGDRYVGTCTKRTGGTNEQSA